MTPDNTKAMSAAERVMRYCDENCIEESGLARDDAARLCEDHAAAAVKRAEQAEARLQEMTTAHELMVPTHNAAVDRAIAAEALLREELDVGARMYAAACGRNVRLRQERDEALVTIARAARAYSQWMDAISPRESFSFPKDAEEHNGIVAHMHEVMQSLNGPSAGAGGAT